jgi:hypothetical protein
VRLDARLATDRTFFRRADHRLINWA